MRVLGIILLGYGATSGLAIASAQDGAGMFERDRNVSVLERPRPDYQAAGVKRGAFIYSPSLEADLELNNNIFATATSEESDIIAVLTPSLDVASTWSRHSVSANATVAHREYFEFGSESVTDVLLSTDSVIDIGKGYTGAVGANYSDLHEPRTSAGAAGRAADPIQYKTYGYYGSLVREVGRTKISGAASFADYDYDDADLIGGGTADQDNRDREEILIEARGDYAISPDTAVFGRLRYITQEYPNTAVGATQRDQDGYTFDVGANFDLGGLARGEVGMGYVTRSYDDVTFSDTEALSIDGAVEWFPTPLTTVAFSANRSVQPAAVANAPSFVSTSVSVGADHELRRNVILSAGFDFGQDDYEGIDRTDDRTGVAIGGTYLLNRYVGLSADFVHTKQDSSGVDGQPDFTVNKFLIGLVLQR